MTVLGRVQAEKDDFGIALLILRQPIELQAEQQSLHIIRAANEAVGLLSTALIAGDQ